MQKIKIKLPTFDEQKKKKNRYSFVKVNESQYKQRGVTPHFSTRQTLLKKYWEKVNIDITNWEELFDRSPDHK